MPKTILVVDDEKDIVELVAYNLAKEGFSVLKAYDGEMALKTTRTKKPTLIILDLMMPGLGGLDVCKAIRRNPDLEAMPIIMLTAKGEELDRILGLEMGADDYITKPFSVKELVARVRAVLRRSETRMKSGSAEVFAFKDLRADFSSYEVTIDGIKVDLGPKEMKLLKFLTEHTGRVYSRDQLLDYVWGDEAYVEPRTVDVHISRLRAAIEKDKENPRYVLTVRGIGYKFADVK
jgi:phosphate regulon transcriptional regulator PhoB